jgi:CRISPR-associated endonuclease/helicase Cas3
MCELNAHSPNDQGKWHSLQEHLQKVAGLCQEFAAKFGSESVARDVALWHDIGKAIPEFQEYLLLCHEKPNQKHRGPDHKGAGAMFALKRLEPLAFLIAGHHGGLQNSDDLRVWLTQRAEKWTDSSIEQLIQGLELTGTRKEELAPPSHVKTPL